MAQWPERLRLFPSVFAMVVVAVVVGVAAYWGFGELLLGVNPLVHLTDKTIHPQDVLKLALTIAAGLGGVVALTVAYRRQRATESGRFGQRFADSAAQLGGTSAAVRMAGAYAMGALADETKEISRRQQCIEVLCAYLRLPYQRGDTSDLLEQVVTTDTTLTFGGQTHNDQRTYRLQPQEREVRVTIVRIIRDHLQEHAIVSWGTVEASDVVSHLLELRPREGKHLGGRCELSGDVCPRHGLTVIIRSRMQEAKNAIMLAR